MTFASNPSVRPRVALISATTSAIAPATAAFAQEFPEARLWNVLDDRLLADAEDSAGVTPELVRRMERLIGYAVAGGADGILLTCSQYGFVSRIVDTPVPVEAPDDASFADVLARGLRSVLVVASLRSALDDTLARLEAAVAAAGTRLRLDGIREPNAVALLAAGKPAQLASELAAAVQGRARRPDAVLLAQYSLAPAAEILQTMIGRPVLSGPVSAAKRLRARLMHLADASEGATALCALAPRAPSTADRPAD